MKKTGILIFATLFTFSSFAQCDPATIKNILTVYTKTASNNLTPEQQKNMAAIFTSVAEPAIKSTKGLRGSWKLMGDFETTPEGYAKSVLESYLALMACKNNKIVNRDEEGLVLNIIYNSFESLFKSEIAIASSHEETVYKKFDESKTMYVKETFEGRQIYYLQPSAATTLSNVVFYRKTGDGEYFVIARPGVPLFIPLTIRQALEINIKNYKSLLAELKRKTSMPGLQPATKAAYEKTMAKDFAEYRKSIPNPEKFITDLISQLEETKLTAIKQDHFFIDSYEKNIALVSAYLKNTASKDLDKPFVTGSTGFLSASFGDNNDATSGLPSFIKEFAAADKYGRFVTLNPAYFNKQVPKSAAQFISVEIRRQGSNSTVEKAYQDFKTNFNLGKLL
jgi:hypothetical protein